LSLRDILDRVPNKALAYAKKQAKMGSYEMRGRIWSLMGDDVPTMWDLDSLKGALSG
jgi:hypothetical protein